MGKLTFGEVGDKNLVQGEGLPGGFSEVGQNEQIFSYWEGTSPPSLPV